MAHRLKLKYNFKELNIIQILVVTFHKHHTLLSYRQDWIS
jgi:hypothetical protein